VCSTFLEGVLLVVLVVVLGVVVEVGGCLLVLVDLELLVVASS